MKLVRKKTTPFLKKREMQPSGESKLTTELWSLACIELRETLPSTLATVMVASNAEVVYDSALQNSFHLLVGQQFVQSVECVNIYQLIYNCYSNNIARQLDGCLANHIPDLVSFFNNEPTIQAIAHEGWRTMNIIK